MFKIIKNFISIVLLYTFSINTIFANVYFSEIMPNTTDDKNLEYLELSNSWDSKQDISWYSIKDKSLKTFDFGYWEYLNAYEEKKYYRSTTKILLNNTNEELYLYDNNW